MIRVDLSSVRPGARLAKPIFNDKGAIWLKAGAELTERYLGLLSGRGIGSVFVEEDATADVVVKEAISDEVRGESTAAVGDLVAEMTPAIEEARAGGQRALLGWLRTSEARSLARDATTPGRIQNAAMHLVTDVLRADPSAAIISPKGRDDYVLAHAVDVATTAVTIGKLLHLPRHHLLALARGCLLMDVGLAMVDPAILSKSTPLTTAERDAIRAHPRMGHELLRALNPADILTNTVALQHHERQDGQGYPRGLRGNNRVHLSAFDRERAAIVLLAEIAAVADVYDALSSDRPHRRALQPDQVVATLRRIAGSHLNRAIVDEFLRHQPVYPVGLSVYVYGPRFGPFRGVVVRVNPLQLDRPVVRLFQNGRGRDVDPFEMDLGTAFELTIRGAPVALAA